MENKNLEIILKVLGEKIRDLELTLSCREYEIKELKEKIKKLEEKKENE